jgi:hypothetical protein
MDQSQYLAQALRAMQETPADQPQVNPQAMGLGRMQPGQMGQPGQPQDPNARPSIGDNLQQAWQNVQGAPQRVQSSIMGLGQLFK